MQPSHLPDMQTLVHISSIVKVEGTFMVMYFIVIAGLQYTQPLVKM